MANVSILELKQRLANISPTQALLTAVCVFKSYTRIVMNLSTSISGVNLRFLFLAVKTPTEDRAPGITRCMFSCSPVSFVNRYQSEEFAHCVCCSAGKGRGCATNGGRQPWVQDTPPPPAGGEHSTSSSRKKMVFLM